MSRFTCSIRLCCTFVCPPNDLLSFIYKCDFRHNHWASHWFWIHQRPCPHLSVQHVRTTSLSVWEKLQKLLLDDPTSSYDEAYWGHQCSPLVESSVEMLSSTRACIDLIEMNSLVRSADVTGPSAGRVECISFRRLCILPDVTATVGRFQLVCVPDHMGTSWHNSKRQMLFTRL